MVSLEAVLAFFSEVGSSVLLYMNSTGDTDHSINNTLVPTILYHTVHTIIIQVTHKIQPR